MSQLNFRLIITHKCMTIKTYINTQAQTLNKNMKGGVYTLSSHADAHDELGNFICGPYLRGFELFTMLSTNPTVA
jgi:hypothetical protein